MRILHTADIHFGQNIYQHYDRLDEHIHFFKQLQKWIETYSPDALIISGDIYDVAQPAASVWSAFNAEIVELRRKFPSLSIILIAGNHDSASRIESHSKVWDIAGVTMIGTPPPILNVAPEGWEERYVVRLTSGFVIAVPYTSGERTDTMLHLQEYVESINTGDLPIVMTGHLAAIGSDIEGHDPEIGNLRTVAVEKFGTSYDYLALGHIHKSQTLGYAQVYDEKPHNYASPVARYSGSVLHVSENENYPHSVSLVDIDRHRGEVTVRQLKIDQLRHFVTLPKDKAEPFAKAKEAIAYLKKYVKNNDKEYIRLRMSKNADIPADFNSSVYDIIDKSGKDIRYNPRMIFVSPEDDLISEPIRNQYPMDMEEIKQMTDPREFVRKTSGEYPGLTEDELDDLFREVEEYMKNIDAENQEFPEQ
ncbi:MAG: exonuclease SbcCD subunit D [Muribaculaceae bacterium]|nr:exonuclease SbcCD subunit D [Muribaculaceae bacterium]